MALIYCGECGKGISSRAMACPQCGDPIATASDVQAAGTAILTTQGTAKKFKMQKIKAALMMMLGALLSLAFHNPWAGAAGGLLFLVGLTWLCITSMQVWWHHA
jgi:hypothetical protein